VKPSLLDENDVDELHEDEQYKLAELQELHLGSRQLRKSDLFDFSTQALYGETKDNYCKNTKMV
jgi:hypothetical protein